jgi:GNAT superfamily N-acetyltransferase
MGVELGEIAIRPLADAEIAQLERAPWSSGLKEKHRLRQVRQGEGEVAYLVFWQGETPVGHMLLKWSGPHNDVVAARIASCAEIEDFVVAPELRSRGIGRRALAQAEQLTRERGLRRLGLAVGLDNPRARALYERVGFADAGCGEITVRWQYPGRDGQKPWAEQRCVYLVKEVEASGSEGRAGGWENGGGTDPTLRSG